MLFRVTLLFLLSVPILVGYLWMFISTFAVRTHGLMPVDAQGIIIAVDRVLDMCRTSVNVWSDSCGCAVLARFEGSDDASGGTTA